jgi:hypothetical protein
MSKHVGRKQRWARQDTKTYLSDLGKVRYEQDAWYALLNYRTRVRPETEGGQLGWQPHSQRLGPFKRPRNAMIALEREVTFLTNHHGKDILFGDQLASGGR